MYTQDELTKIVFFDLETAAGEKTLDDLTAKNPRMSDLWSRRCDYLRSKFPENEDKTDEELYENMSPLQPEFNRIVCASFGRITFSGSTPNMVIKTFCSEVETEILEGISKVFTKFSTLKFCGHNIKKFDVPVMCKRLIINEMELPKYLRVHDMKPWEMPFIDTQEMWSFGSWKDAYTSLDLLTAAIGIDSPKDDIKGEDVSATFWKDQDLDRIARYCEKDVYSLGQALLKMSGQKRMHGYEGTI